MHTEATAQIIGHIGNIDINENGDKKMAVLSVGSNDTWKDSDGNKQERTNWTRVVVWQPSTVEFIEKHMKTGRLILVRGDLRTREFEQDGNKRFITEVHAKDVAPLDKKPNE